MNLKLLFIFVCVLISFVLFGCKNEKIKFYRESGVQQLMDNAKESLNFNSDSSSVTTTKSKSGVVIYKDNSTKDTTGGRATFGPRDIQFGVPEQ